MSDEQRGLAESERRELLEQISDLLERPMLLLSLAWLVLVVADLAGYSRPWMEPLNWVLWGAFVLQFLLEFAIAPEKGRYLRTNWLTAVSLFLPALRLLRVARLARLLRAARAARGLRLVRVVSTANRGLRTARTVLARRGLAYVILINVVVLFVGAGGMFAFEQPGLATYGDSLWWTAMLLTTLGAGYEPLTPEGRVLAFLLALFAFSVFGYLTATLASLFVRQDREEEGALGASDAPAPPGVAEELRRLREEVALLRHDLHDRR